MYNTKKVQHEKSPQKVQGPHENSATQKKCNTKLVQHEKSATQKWCKMKKVQHRKAQRKKCAAQKSET